METTWLHKNGHKKLIVFCNGWGMDACPFRSLISVEFDVYMLFDYRQLTHIPAIETLVEGYEQVHLVSWSMGVWAGQRLFAGKHDLFDRTLAINGTLCPIDDGFGIPEKVFNATLTGFNEASRLKFYKRMCRQKDTLNFFLLRQPQRSVKDQGEELAALQKTVDCSPASVSIYDEIIVSESDFIIPTANQLKYWQEKQVTQVAGFHFLFNLWLSWDQLLNVC